MGNFSCGARSNARPLSFYRHPAILWQKLKSGKKASAVEDSDFPLILHIQGDEILLPFFFEGTDFLEALEIEFFAALDDFLGIVLSASLSEPSSEFVSKTVECIKDLKPCVPDNV